MASIDVSSTDGRATDIFGPGEGGPVFLSEVQCSGSETNLTLCLSVGLGQHSCDLQSSAGVICGKSGEFYISYNPQWQHSYLHTP